MKKIKLTLLCMFFTCLLFAQQNFQDVVYLKNGSVIRGVIVEQVPNVWSDIDAFVERAKRSYAEAKKIGC